MWYRAVADCLMDIGFTRTKASECLFIPCKGKKTAIILSYVDDMCLFGTRSLIEHAIRQISRMFEISDMGTASFFLGVNIIETDEAIYLSQRSLIYRIISGCNMFTCKPPKTPLAHSHSLYRERKEPTDEEANAMCNIP